MCGNRVDELESRVKELEASVTGLTDELVECKVRLRELEDAIDEDIGFVPESTDEADAESTEEAEASKSEVAESDDDTEEADSDIIVA
ncbi:MAG: bZIP transcription factor [Halovenus sp.]